MEDAVKMLGFYHFIDSSKSNHVKEMTKKGVHGVDRMKTGKLPNKDAWMGSFAQLLPGINWGVVAVVITTKALQRCYQDLYYKMLTLLGINRNIGKEWRTLPERYQGLGLPDFEVHALSKMIHFLQHRWDGNKSTSKMTVATYKAFMVEVGMYGNIFSRLLEELNVLAIKHTWYYNLWELCHRLGVELEVNDKYHNKSVRQ